jgi:hypothetical protein
MKNNIKVMLAALLLIGASTAFVACRKSEVKEVNKSSQYSPTQRVSASAPGEPMDWCGEIHCDCENTGTKCAVVYPDAAYSTGWHEACINGTLEQYIQNNGETFGFPQELLDNLIGAGSINVKQGNGGLQYRPIN